MADEKMLYTGRFLQLRDRGGWEYCERTKANGVVVLVATTVSDEFLLVEQYRPPVQAAVIELPAGLVGDEPELTDEPMVQAAKRELEEETGYRAGQLEELAVGPSSAGLTSETITLFRASGCTRVGPGGGVDGEDITVHVVTMQDVRRWLRARAMEQRLIDPKVYAGLWLSGIA